MEEGGTAESGQESGQESVTISSVVSDATIPIRVGNEAAPGMDWEDNLEGIADLFAESKKNTIRSPIIKSPKSISATTPRPPEGRPSGGSDSFHTDSLLIPEVQQPVTSKDHAAVTMSGSNLVTATLQPPEGQSGDVQQRIQLYIKRKKKEETVGKLLALLGDKQPTYEAVLKISSRNLAAPTLEGGASTPAALVGSFYAEGDGRISRVHLKTSLSAKVNVTYSFNPATFTCCCCEANRGHRVFNHRVEEAEARELILLTDQSYPACFPSLDNKKCIVSIRVENGSMKELLAEFLEATRATKLAAGSVVMVSSLSHLAAVGTAAYLEDLAAMRRFVKKARGASILVGPLPPIFSAKVVSLSLAKSAKEVAQWMGQLPSSEECVPRAATMLASAILERSSGGSPVRVIGEMMRLPADMDESGKKVFFMGETDIKGDITPITEDEERELIGLLVQELKEKFAMSISDHFSFSRDPTVQAGGNSDTIMVIGSSNAKRLAEELTQVGKKVGTVICPNWRAVRGAVDRMSDSLREAILQHNPGVVVLYLLDNSIYYARWEDGSMIPAGKGQDGYFHVDGELTVAPRANQDKIFSFLGELLDIAKGRKRVVVIPLPRYVTAPCCGDPEHIPNRRDASFSGTIREDLAKLRRHLKDFLFVTNRRDTVIMDPNITVRNLAATEIWEADPVHPKQAIYAKMATDLIALQEVTPGKRKAPDSDSSGTQTTVSGTRGRPSIASQEAGPSGPRGSHGGWRGRPFRGQHKRRGGYAEQRHGRESWDQDGRLERGAGRGRAYDSGQRGGYGGRRGGNGPGRRPYGRRLPRFGY